LNLFTRIKQFFAPAPKPEVGAIEGVYSIMSDPGLSYQDRMCCMEILWGRGLLTTENVSDLMHISETEARRLICDFYSQIH
jgi:hypothetical protein